MLSLPCTSSMVEWHSHGCVGWLEERLETVYKKDPTYSDKASSLSVLDLGPPEKLPDALRGERWSFVQLPLSALEQELVSVQKVCGSDRPVSLLFTVVLCNVCFRQK